MISVVVDTSGREDSLRSTLESLEGNVSTEWQIVVVGDLSPRMASQQLPFGSDFVTAVNTGDAAHAEALNVGLRHARGDIVGCLVAGDTYFEDTLTLVHQYAKAHDHHGIFYGDAMVTYPSSGETREFVTDRQEYPQGRRKCRLCGAATFYRRRILEDLGSFDESLKFWPEYDFWLRFCGKGGLFKRIPRLLAKRTHISDGRTTSDFTTLPSLQSLEELTSLRLSRDRSRSADAIIARHLEAAHSLPPVRNNMAHTARQPFPTHVSSRIRKAIHDLPFSQRVALQWHVTMSRLRGNVAREFALRSHEPLKQLRRYWLQRRLFRFVHHSPKRLRIPSRYAATPAPRHPPVISIVTPSLNQGHCLETTIQSVLSQNYPALEYVVQDGGSVDTTLAILQKHQKQLSAWESKPDNGQSDAVNRGFRKTTGEVMAYLNSDDILLPGTLSYVAQAFRKYPNIDVFYGHRVIIDEDGRELGRWVLPMHDDHAIQYADYIPQETMFWRRSAWERVGAKLDESFQSALDWDLILRFRKAGCIFKRLPRFLAAFRVWPGQKSVAWWLPTGRREAERLTSRVFGETPDHVTIRRETAGYLRRHWLHDKAYLLGLLRY